MKILVADDNADGRQLLAEMLHDWGHEALGAEDGRVAWETLAGKDPPKLAILDWVMPRIDGLELCRRLRKMDTGNPPYLILLTSKTGPQHVVSALEAGANDYITKPCNYDELRARVQVGCRILDLQAQLQEQERLQGRLQMAGAMCHELNQPLQAALSCAEFLAANLSPEDANHEAAITIQDSVRRMGQMTRRIMSLTPVHTREYLSTPNHIVDLAGPRNQSNQTL